MNYLCAGFLFSAPRGSKSTIAQYVIDIFAFLQTHNLVHVYGFVLERNHNLVLVCGFVIERNHNLELVCGFVIE